MKTKAKDNFLMSPKVDYCFKELLAYSEIRKGFIAAILNKDPEEIADMTGENLEEIQAIQKRLL